MMKNAMVLEWPQHQRKAHSTRLIFYASLQLVNPLPPPPSHQPLKKNAVMGCVPKKAKD